VLDKSVPLPFIFGTATVCEGDCKNHGINQNRKYRRKIAEL
jgi:hypothetical protein